jgi:hypothetical protein
MRILEKNKDDRLGMKKLSLDFPGDSLGTLYLEYPISVFGALRKLPKKWWQFWKFTDGFLTLSRATLGLYFLTSSCII